MGSCGSLPVLEKACLEDTSNLVQSKSFFLCASSFFLSLCLVYSLNMNVFSRSYIITAHSPRYHMLLFTVVVSICATGLYYPSQPFLPYPRSPCFSGTLYLTDPCFPTDPTSYNTTFICRYYSSMARALRRKCSS